VDLYNGKNIQGTVLYQTSGNNQPDVAVIRLNSKEQLPFVPIAETDYDVRQGSNAVRVGCPGGGSFLSTNCLISDVTGSYRGSSNYASLNTRETAKQGESGGPLYQNGRQIALLWGSNYKDASYTKLNEIRYALQQAGVGNLVRIILIFKDLNI
jgi:hypothetical protein